MQESSFALTYPDEPGRVIRGRVCAPGKETPSGPWVMLLHGFKGFMDWGFFPLLARGLAEGGINSVRFNTSGSGVGSDLEYYSDPDGFKKDTYSRQLEDIARVRQAIDAGEFGPLDPDRGALMGHSRGGGLAVLHAAEHPYAGLVTWAAVTSVEGFSDKVIQQWRADGYLDVPNTRTGHTMRMGLDIVHDVDQNKDRLNILGSAPQVEVPTLVLHGSADETVPVASAHQLGEALANAQVHVLEGANHTFGAGHPLVDVTEDLAQCLALTMGHIAHCLGLD